MNKSLELIELVEKYSDASGTYVSVEYDPNDSEAIYEFYKDIVPEMYTPNSIHTTLMYSKDTPYLSIQPSLIGTVLSINNPKYEIFGEKKDCLVVSFDSDILSDRHQELTDMGLKHSWDEYRPHITLSDSLPSDFSADNLPDFPLKEIKIVIEKSETIK